MARLKYGVKDVRMVVLHATYNGVDEYPVIPEFIEHAAIPLYGHVALCMKQLHEQRAAEREYKKLTRARHGTAMSIHSFTFNGES
jgi:hypothetical protein